MSDLIMYSTTVKDAFKHDANWYKQMLEGMALAGVSDKILSIAIEDGDEELVWIDGVDTRLSHPLKGRGVNLRTLSANRETFEFKDARPATKKDIRRLRRKAVLENISPFLPVMTILQSTTVIFPLVIFAMSSVPALLKALIFIPTLIFAVVRASVFWAEVS